MGPENSCKWMLTCGDLLGAFRVPLTGVAVFGESFFSIVPCPASDMVPTAGTSSTKSWKRRGKLSNLSDLELVESMTQDAVSKSKAYTSKVLHIPTNNHLSPFGHPLPGPRRSPQQHPKHPNTIGLAPPDTSQQSQSTFCTHAGSRFFKIFCLS